MNQTQLRNLQKLVDGDFAHLRNQVQISLGRLYDSRLRELAGGETGLPMHIHTRISQVEDRVGNEINVLRDFLAQEGWSTGKHGGYGDAFEFKIHRGYLANKSVDQKRSELQKARDRILQQASAVVSQHHLRVNRAILLQGITGSGAQDILNSLPSEEKVLEAITTQLEDYEEDLALLNGTTQEG